MKRVDTGHGQRRGIEPRPFEGLDVKAVGRAATQHAVAIHVDEHRGDLEQGVCVGVEAPRLDIHDHRQEPAEAPRHEHGARSGRALRAEARGRIE